MTLQQICVSLELAKQLKEAGYPQKSLFWWAPPDRSDIKQHISAYPGLRPEMAIAAPTASEILNILPCRIWVNGTHYEITLFKADKHWHEDGSSDDHLTYGFSYEAYKDGVIHCLDIGVYGNCITSDISIQEAAGGMYLLLKKQGLLTSPNQA